jgi:hypothetical protein
MSATASSRRAAVAKVPDLGGSSSAPSLRGKNSYHEPTRAVRRWTRSGHGPLGVTPSRIGCRSSRSVTVGSVAAASRTGVGRLPASRVRAAVSRLARPSTSVGGRASAAFSSSSAPSVNSSSTSTPAGILMVARCTQVSHGLPHASRVKVQSPTASGRTRPSQASSPIPSGRMRTDSARLPSGRCSRTVSPMLSCPSRKAVARIGTASPTAAAAGRRPPRLVGETPVIGKRPVSSAGGFRVMASHVAAGVVLVAFVVRRRVGLAISAPYRRRHRRAVPSSDR